MDAKLLYIRANGRLVYDYSWDQIKDEPWFKVEKPMGKKQENKPFPVRLTKIKSTHDNLRTDVVDGWTFMWPPVKGERFLMWGEGLSDKNKTRTVFTSPIKGVREIATEPNSNLDAFITGYEFETENSTYRLQLAKVVAGKIVMVHEGLPESCGTCMDACPPGKEGSNDVWKNGHIYVNGGNQPLCDEIRKIKKEGDFLKKGGIAENRGIPTLHLKPGDQLRIVVDESGWGC